MISMIVVAKRLLLLSIGSILIIAACQSTPPPTEVPTLSGPTSTRPPTATPTPVVVNTPAPTIAVAVTATPSPSPTPTLPAPTPAVSTRDVYVSAGSMLNLRAGANTSATLIKTLAAGTHLTAIGEATAPDANGIAWQNVRADDGQAGWVAAQYLLNATPVPSPTSTPSTTTTSVFQPGFVYVASTSGLNLRNNHHESATLLATLANGQRLQTNGLTFGPDDDGLVWLNVKTDDNIEGWVSSDFVSSIVPSVAPAKPPENETDIVNELLKRTNALRAQNALPPFKLDPALSALSLGHSQYMAQNGITHSDANGLSPAKRLALENFTGQLTENIFGGQATIDDAWNFWSTDPPHLANLLNAVDTIIGIGVYQTGAATYYTQDFAKPPAQ